MAAKPKYEIAVSESGGNFYGSFTDYSGLNICAVSVQGPSKEWVTDKLTQFLDSVGITDGVKPIPDYQPEITPDDGEGPPDKKEPE